MAVLITGGNGRLARALAETLAPDMEVRLFDQRWSAPPPEGVQHVEGDLRDLEQVGRALDGVDVIVHLAALTAAQEYADPITALDVATRGSYVLAKAANARQVARMVVGSSLSLFDRLPAHWRVNESWRPRPTPALDDLCPWLAELSVKECTRAGALQAVCLRFGRIVDAAAAAGSAYDSRWVHVDDAVQGVQRALAYEAPRRPSWAVFHIMGAGVQAKVRHGNAMSAEPRFAYQPVHDLAAGQPAPSGNIPLDARPWREVLAPLGVPSRPIRRVVILGAGGPMGAVTTQELASSYRLRITDIRPIGEIAAEGKPQSPGAPLPIPMGPPHENRLVDVRDPGQVMAACDGEDAIVNCTVVRPHPVDAFLVNTIGAYNVMVAAVAHGIRRVVHTGPLVQHVTGWGDYLWDYDIHVDAPARPYEDLYIHSKYLGQEICRVFAEYHGLEVPVLLFAALYNPSMPARPNPFMISWPDTGRALRRGLEVTSLPSPYEMMNISADLPHDKFNHDKARRLLDWTPRDGLDDFWQEG